MQPGETTIWATCPSHGRLDLTPRDFELIAFRDGTIEPQFQCPRGGETIELPADEQAILSLQQVGVPQRAATGREQRRFFDRHPWDLLKGRSALVEKAAHSNGQVIDELIAQVAEWHPELTFIKRLDFAVGQIVARRLPHEISRRGGESPALSFVPSALLQQTEAAAKMLAVAESQATGESPTTVGLLNRRQQAADRHEACSAALTEVRAIWREALELSASDRREQKHDLLWVKDPARLSDPELDGYIDQLAAEAHKSVATMAPQSSSQEL